MPTSGNRARDAGWLALGALWLVATNWMRPLALPDEGRYVGVAWAMLTSGDWLVPQLNGLPFFHKPPLFYWITASALSLFGPHEWAGRVAPFIGAATGMLAVWWLARRWAGPITARLLLPVLLVQPLYFGAAQYANLDMLVAGMITATIALCAHAVLSRRAGLPHRKAVLAAWGFAALGVLAKGLIGAVLPALVLLAWLVPARDWRGLASLFWWPAALLFGLLAAPWFVLMQQRFPAFFDYFFVVQHFKRYAETGFNNAQPWWFYFAVLAVLSVPWVAWLPAALRRSWRATEANPLRPLMWIWLSVVVLFFSLPASKLVGYVLPAVPPLAFLIADGAAPAVSAAGRARKWWTASVLAGFALCLGLIIALSVQQPRSSAAIGRTLAETRQPGEPVLFVDEFAYDVPFYARLESPVLVVADWAGGERGGRDNWLKELRDAARFAPAAAAAATLLEPKELVAHLCAQPRSWLVGVPSSPERFAILAHASEVARTKGSVLWRVDRDAPQLANDLQCESKVELHGQSR